jgi:5'-3' exonuclease
MTYIILDAANLFFRGRHVTMGSLEDKIGLSMHTVLTSIRKVWRDFNGTHVVVCLEGRSWRKDFYPQYKKNRADLRAKQTPQEIKEDQLFWETFDQFKDFIKDKTNCTVLQHPQLEADDLIAGWIKYHPDSQHVIISTDGDFAQLVSPNVRQYNGVTDIITSHEGYFDGKGNPVVDKKTKEIKAAPDPEWLLFEKCIRGDTSDNVFSAYPGVRTKGSKNKVGLIEAYTDRKSRGYNWNNLMLQRWIDHEGQEHRVLEDYQRNVLLCDLNAQPDHIKKTIDETITQTINQNKNIPQIGVRLLKFCSNHSLVKIIEQIESYAGPLSSPYNKEKVTQ